LALRARVWSPRAQLSSTTIPFGSVSPWQSLLRLRIRIAGRLDGPQRHHGVILVHYVVAMHRITPGKIAEAEEQNVGLVVVQLRNVFAGVLHQWRWSAVARDDLVFFEMNVDGMHPAPRVIDDRPGFRRILGNCEPVDIT